MLNIKHLKETFDTASFSEKKEVVITILEVFLGKGENFNLIYYFIQEHPEHITKRDINEVFQILIIGLYQDSQEKIKETALLLENIKEKITHIHTQEAQEKKNEDNNTFLENQFNQL